MSQRVGAIMVLFNPEPSLLKRAIAALEPQVGWLCVVDNSAVSNEHLLPQSAKITYLPQESNTGIAAAQNVGLRHLMTMEGCEYVLFSDQDTVACKDLVKGLVQAYENLEASGPVTAVGPTAINSFTGKPYPSTMPMDYVMSSMSLSRMSDFHTVGMMNESLMIDGVECEWQWRAKHLDSRRRVWQVPNLLIHHQLGRSRNILGRDCNISSPFRVYYQIRNYLWLRRLSYVPHRWKRRNLLGTIEKAIIYPLCFGHNGAYLRSVARGLRDGLTHKITQ